MRALVVEDDPMSQQLIQAALQRDGVVIEPTGFGEDAVELAKLYDFDIVLLDLTLPDLDGYDVIRQMRSAKVRTPVLILSGRLEVDDKVKTLSSGADDYVTKPFYPEELAARLQAVVRRSKGHSESVIRTGALVVNFDTRTVEVGGRRLHVTGKEYNILELLSLRKGVTLTKEMFLDHLYGGMDEPELKIIDVFVCKLRKKIAQLNAGVHYIETVWGRGYMLKDPEAAPEPDDGDGVAEICAPATAAALL